MKALTLQQPWASLVSSGNITALTLPWAPKISLVNTEIAIYAHETLPNSIPTDVRLGAEEQIGRKVEDLPRACVICLATIKAVFEIEEQGRTREGEAIAMEKGVGRWVTIDRWGDFRIGRWCWILNHVRVFGDPIACRGGSKIWEWTDPRAPAMTGRP